MTPWYYLVSLLALLAFSPADAAAKGAIVRPRSLVLKEQLRVRGGGVKLPVDPTQVAKVATAVSLIHGTVNYLAPGPTCEAYGVKDSIVTRVMMKSIGLELLGIGIMAYCLLFDRCGVDKATGIICLLWVLEIAARLLNDEVGKVGGDSKPSYIGLAITAFFVYGANQDFAPTVTKVVAGYTLLNGVMMALAPKSTLKAWGVTEDDPAAIAMTKDFGFWATAFALYLGFLTQGADPIKALGYSRLFILFRSLVINFVSKDVDSIGMKKPQQNFWLLYHAVVAAALTLGEAPAAESTP